jgi:hypothetical protein
MPPSHILFKKTKKKKKRKYDGAANHLRVAEPPPGQTRWMATPVYFIFFSFFLWFFFWGDFFSKKYIYVIGVVWEKNVKVVKFPQFESLGGRVSVTFETLDIKVQMGV